MSRLKLVVFLVLGLPLSLAALFASAALLMNSLSSGAESVHAQSDYSGSGGYTVTPVTGRSNNYLVLTKHSENPFKQGELRQTMTVYEIRPAGKEGEADLHLIGSRCIEHDSGPDLVKLKSPKGESPDELKKQIEKMIETRKAKQKGAR